MMCYTAISFADKFEANATYRVCFTPGENCTQEIVDAINQSQTIIRVQAYSFTSAPIARALIDASKHGVHVEVILDKSQFRHNKYSSVKFLTHYGIPVWVDDQPTIAHNKVMIIDNKTVITGSFNFTKAAQNSNTENVIIINDAALAKKYLNNWQDRLEESTKVSPTNTDLPSHHDDRSSTDKFEVITRKLRKILRSYH